MTEEDKVKEDADELALLTETLEVETRLVAEIGEAPPPPLDWVASHERAHAQKVREHLTTRGR